MRWNEAWWRSESGGRSKARWRSPWSHSHASGRPREPGKGGLWGQGAVERLCLPRTWRSTLANLARSLGGRGFRAHRHHVLASQQNQAQGPLHNAVLLPHLFCLDCFYFFRLAQNQIQVLVKCDKCPNQFP